MPTDERFEYVDLSAPQGMTPGMPVRPPQHQPPRPQPPRPPQHQPPRPQPPRPQPPRPPQHGPVIPNRPRPPRPQRPHSLPLGFPLLAQAQLGLVVTGFGRVDMHSLPVIFSPIIDRIPHNSFVWVFGERNGWSAVHYDGRIGFVDSRFVLILRN